jgi:hypothetical protein
LLKTLSEREQPLTKQPLGSVCNEQNDAKKGNLSVWRQQPSRIATNANANNAVILDHLTDFWSSKNFFGHVFKIFVVLSLRKFFEWSLFTLNS